jgi:hypothetical protein
MIESVYKKEIEFRFLFELDVDCERWVESVHTEVSSYADVESYPPDYVGNTGYLKLLIHNEIFDNENDYLKILIEKARECDDCHYIEETINEINKYTGKRTYGPRPDGL